MPLVVEPFLHVERSRIFNPLTDRSLASSDPAFGILCRLRETRAMDVEPEVRARLIGEGWLVEDDGRDLARRYRLKYASVEANTAGNQACYFCPVATDPRNDVTMPMVLYERIVEQLSAHRSTIDAVSMVQYNEPTIDRHFLDRVAALHRHGMPPALVTNGSGLSPARVDALQTLDEVLGGPEFARLRRLVYGLDEAPADFMCRHCIYARRA